MSTVCILYMIPLSVVNGMGYLDLHVFFHMRYMYKKEFAICYRFYIVCIWEIYIICMVMLCNACYNECMLMHSYTITLL